MPPRRKKKWFERFCRNNGTKHYEKRYEKKNMIEIVDSDEDLDKIDREVAEDYVRNVVRCSGGGNIGDGGSGSRRAMERSREKRGHGENVVVIDDDAENVIGWTYGNGVDWDVGENRGSIVEWVANGDVGSRGAVERDEEKMDGRDLRKDGDFENLIRWARDSAGDGDIEDNRENGVRWIENGGAGIRARVKNGEVDDRDPVKDEDTDSVIRRACGSGDDVEEDRENGIRGNRRGGVESRRGVERGEQTVENGDFMKDEDIENLVQWVRGSGHSGGDVEEDDEGKYDDDDGGKVVGAVEEMGRFVMLDRLKRGEGYVEDLYGGEESDGDKHVGDMVVGSEKSAEVDEEILYLGGRHGMEEGIGDDDGVDDVEELGNMMEDYSIVDSVESTTCQKQQAVSKMSKAHKLRALSVIEDIIQFSHEVCGQGEEHHIHFVKVLPKMRQLILPITNLGLLEARFVRKQTPKMLVVTATKKSLPINQKIAGKILRKLLGEDYFEMKQLLDDLLRSANGKRKKRMRRIGRQGYVCDVTDLRFERMKQLRMNRTERKKKRGSLLSQQPIGEQNKGHALLRKMGWKEGDGLGKGSQGRIEPVSVHVHSGRRGLGMGR